MKILTIVDSFKGTISSFEISKLLNQHYQNLNHETESITISDGGEGFIDAVDHRLHAKRITMDTIGPLGKAIKADYLVLDDVAYLELNQAAGMNQINQKELNPLYTTTFGLGLMIKHAIKHYHVKSIVLGLGGSSTNDGGTGMLQALGVKFYHHEALIDTHMNGQTLGMMTSFDDRLLKETIDGVEFIIASDVDNPLLGKNGCCYVYAPQKGADKVMQDILEQHMTSYALIVERYYHQSFNQIKGAGAAGGVGFAALAFLNAKIRSGIDFMIDHLDLETQIKTCDLVIVGEGKIDAQTNYGKAPYGIAKLAKKYHKKVIGICAILEEQVVPEYMDEVYAIVPQFATIEESLLKPIESLTKMIENMKV